ncbi:MAG TPA: hypothetical protein VEB86_19950 [Chryseosolibacter sp.]|nr:hypothetical protein [Chryseosolibacter sp.]
MKASKRKKEQRNTKVVKAIRRPRSKTGIGSTAENVPAKKRSSTELSDEEREEIAWCPNVTEKYSDEEG